MFECENSPPPPPSKKLWSRPLGPPVHTVKRKQFSFLPSPPLPFSFLSSQLSRRTHPETLATPDKRCLHITFVFRSLPWSPSFIVNLHHFTIRSQHAALRKEQRPLAVILNYYAKYIDNFCKQSKVEKRGRNNKVTVLRRVSVQENVWSFLPGSQNSGRKAGFHCTF